MRFGITFVPDASPEKKTATAYYQDVIRLSQIADEAGLSWVKMTEHYIHPYGGYCPDPLTFLSAVAMRTNQIRLMTGGVLPVFHHPVILASRAAQVDVISNGRLDLGFARGYLPYEHEMFAVPMDESHERYDSAVAAITRLLTEEKVTEHTPYFDFDNATLLPRPVQNPVPLWSAAVRSERSFVRIGDLGHGLLATPQFKPLAQYSEHCELYRESFDKAGHTSTSQVVTTVPIFVAPTDQEAIEVGDRLFQHYLDTWIDAANSWNDKDSTSFPGYADMGKRLGSLTAAQWREQGSTFMGSPSRVAEQLRTFHEASGGFDGLIAQVDFGAAPGELMERSVRLFIDEVIGELSDL